MNKDKHGCFGVSLSVQRQPLLLAFIACLADPFFVFIHVYLCSSVDKIKTFGFLKFFSEADDIQVYHEYLG